jgi:DNA-binding XRE family transcriptional regulator
MIATRPQSPNVAAIKQARNLAGLSQSRAASTVYVSKRAWQTYEDGTVTMKVGLWELFLFKTGQLFLAPLVFRSDKKTTRHTGKPENLTPYQAQANKEPRPCSH